MTLESFINKTQETIKDNAPTILAGLGVGGVVATGLLAYKAGRVYQQNLIEATHIIDPNDRVLTGKEKFELGWRRVAPVILIGGVTAACVIGGTAIGNRRNAALMSAIAVGETAFREYRDKVEQVVGKPKATKVVDEIAADKVRAAETDGSEIVFLGTDKVLCFDTLTGRFFESTRLEIERAEVDINRQILGDMYASQNDFYGKIGLGRVAGGDDIGWNNDRPLEIQFTAVLEDDKPVLAMSYRFPPQIGYTRPW
jgi:hypothetical protein